MTVSHKAGDILDGDNFDKLIAGKFPPVRRRSETMDFQPTIAVDYTAHTSECQEQDSQFGAIEGLVKGRRYIAGALFIVAIVGLALWATVKYAQSFL